MRLSQSIRSAFTLLELLVVIGIICILAALLMPAMSAAKKSANDSKCLSNLRQLGIGIADYTTDHDGILPGPCPAGVGRVLSTSNKTELIYFLQPYLGLPKPTATAIYPDILHCPALDAVAAKLGTTWYNLTLFDAYSNNDLPTGMKYLPTVFGSSDDNPAVQPLRLGSLDSSMNHTLKDANGETGTLATIAAIREIDGTLKSWPWAVAPTPVHGDHEKALFLDWHVGRVNPADYKVN